MLDLIRKIKWADIKSVAMLIITFFPGTIIRFFSSPIWIVAEYEEMARDNGYWFYKYLKENHPRIKSYYPLLKTSPDYEKIKPLGNIIKYGSFKHYVLFWAASVYCSSSATQGFPYARVCEEIVLHNLHNFKYVFLNHGITRGHSYIVDGKTTNYDILCTCSEIDKYIIINENNQTEEVVKNTGFARHDNLDETIVDNHLLVIMPTWREWLSYRNAKNKRDINNTIKLFLNSNYYKKYIELLNNNEFVSFIEKEGLTVIFYLHQYAQVYSDYFNSCSKKIIVGTNTQYDVQDLLKRASLLITDYSSVCYDYAYMKKPMLYYQFDKEEFENKQYSAGSSFSYEENGFGKISYNVDNLIDSVKKLHAEEFKMDEKYKKRVDQFFSFRDKKNCERIYQIITQ